MRTHRAFFLVPSLAVLCAACATTGPARPSAEPPAPRTIPPEPTSNAIPAPAADRMPSAVEAPATVAPAPPPPAPVSAGEVGAFLARHPTGSKLLDKAIRAAYAGGVTRFRSGAAAAVVDRVASLPDHGLGTTDYHLDALAAASQVEHDLLLMRAAALLARDLHPTAAGDPKAIGPLLEAVAGAPEATLAGLVPKDPQYARLQGALARFRGLELPPVTTPRRGKLGPGVTDPSVRDLRRRLNAEGWAAGDPDAAGADTFDDGLADVLKAWQVGRTIPPSGKVDGQTLTELRVKAPVLADKIRRSLHRWRRSPTRAGGTYVRVNIPAFEAHLVVGGQLDRTHRVVVGGTMGKNQTPGLRATIRRVVLNPIWRVPPRIKSEELDVERTKDPDYYRKHGFRVRIGKDGTESVEQAPGRGNALGQVKLLFPNNYDVYMHDTSKRAAFDRTVRTLSHGCVRVDDPITLARRVLELDGHPRLGEVDAILGTNRETNLDLATPIPIYLEYNTVTVLDDGRVRFHRDVYGRDRRFDAQHRGRPVARR